MKLYLRQGNKVNENEIGIKMRNNKKKVVFLYVNKIFYQ